MKKLILDLCGGTGAWSRPYADAGYTVLVVTLPQFDINKTTFASDGYIEFRSPSGDVVQAVKTKAIYGIMAAPTCTMFSLARTTAKTPRDFYSAMEPVEACLRIVWEARKQGGLKFWAIENPMGYLRQFLGKPAMTFDPSEFGEDYNKTTDLWGYFKAPRRKRGYSRARSTDDNTRKLPPIPGEYVRDVRMSNLQIRRSITSSKFAEAFFRANK